jgi:hypothetical protein
MGTLKLNVLRQSTPRRRRHGALENGNVNTFTLMKTTSYRGQMTARNDITGDLIASRGANEAYRDGWDRIFSKKTVKEEPKPEETKDIERERLTTEWRTFCEANQRRLVVIPSFQTYKLTKEAGMLDEFFKEPDGL